jgi:hypothetical protein
MVDQMRRLEYQKRAVELLEYACDGDPEKGSPRWLEVTEGRNAPEYSSCGDLAHWMLFRLGFRMRWINRNENRGWKQGMNIAYLVSHGLPFNGQRLEGGDVIVVANEWPQGYDAHAVCVIDQPNERKLLTAESGLPGNGLCSHDLPLKRTIRVVLSLERMIAANDALEAVS